MAFKNASPMVIYGSIISVVSMVLHTIGFSTKYWFSFHNSTSDTTSHIGLWTSCDIEHEEELCYGNTDAGIVFLEVLECLVLIAYIAALISAFHYIFVAKEKGHFFITGLLNLVAGVLGLVGVIMFVIAAVTFAIILSLAAKVFGDDLDGNFNYSFGLCIGGAIGGVVSGILFIIAERSNKSLYETDGKGQVE